jgi:peptide/nickel transport system substrate-binding protein
MLKRNLWTLLSVLVLASMVAAQCGGAAAPPAPATEAPKPAEAPTATPVPPTPTEAAAAALGTIKVGVNAEYPPFESVDASNNVVGFDPDLMAAIATAAGFKVEWVNTRWDGIFVALASGEFDAVMSAATITEERKQTVDFSDPYFNAGQMITVKQGSTIALPADLDGKKVGVQLGTTGDIWVTDNTKAEVVRYDEVTLAFQALANGDVDAVVADGPTSIDVVKANPEMKIMVVGEPFTEEYYGIAVNKKRPEVLAAINNGLAAVKASGEYDKIYAKWFGAPEAKAEDPCAYGGEFKSIEAVDDMTVKFTLCAADVAFPSKMAFSAFAISPAAYLEQTGGGGTELVEKPIGTGPYVLKEWVKGDHITLEANPNYWGEKPKTQTVIFRWSTEGAQRLLELQSGTVDGIDNPTPDDFAKIEADSTLKLYPREALNIFYIGFNNTYKPFDDERVRQAIAMGIDRQRIVDNFYPTGSTVASHFTPCAILGGCEGEEWYKFDPAAAKKLLADAGFPDGFETTITYRDVVRGYLPEPGVVAQDIQAQLEQNLGIKAQIVVMESGAFIDAANAGQIEGIHLLGWGADYPDQTNFLDFHFGSGASPQFGNGFPDIWDVLKKAGSTTDAAQRKTLYGQANDLIKQHVPMVPVAHGGSATVFKATVEGAHASPLTDEKFSVMSIPGQDTLVWMQNAEPIGLYCPDETDGESLRACEQINESLLAYKVGGTDVVPSLAESYEANADLTEWTFHLRQGVTWHDGTPFTAKDVVTSFNSWWDAANPLHKGRVGDFTYFSSLFGAFKNAPPAP